MPILRNRIDRSQFWIHMADHVFWVWSVRNHANRFLLRNAFLQAKDELPNVGKIKIALVCESSRGKFHPPYQLGKEKKGRLRNKENKRRLRNKENKRRLRNKEKAIVNIIECDFTKEPGTSPQIFQ